MLRRLLFIRIGYLLQHFLVIVKAMLFRIRGEVGIRVVEPSELVRPIHCLYNQVPIEHLKALQLLLLKARSQISIQLRIVDSGDLVQANAEVGLDFHLVFRNLLNLFTERLETRKNVSTIQDLVSELRNVGKLGDQLQGLQDYSFV